MESTESTVLSLTMLVVSRGHLLRVTMRRRAGASGRGRTQYRVYHVKKSCRACQAVSKRLVGSARKFSASVTALLADGHRPAR